MQTVFPGPFPVGKTVFQTISFHWPFEVGQSPQFNDFHFGVPQLASGSPFSR